MPSEDDRLSPEPQIRFSSHSRRRMHLYGIDERDVRALISKYVQVQDFPHGSGHLGGEELAQKYKYPLKIVFSVQADTVTVVTVYPLRKRFD